MANIGNIYYLLQNIDYHINTNKRKLRCLKKYIEDYLIKIKKETQQRNLI